MSDSDGAGGTQQAWSYPVRAAADENEHRWTFTVSLAAGAPGTLVSKLARIQANFSRDLKGSLDHQSDPEVLSALMGDKTRARRRWMQNTVARPQLHQDSLQSGDCGLSEALVLPEILDHGIAN
ncbi:hypothetical protein POX_b02270 [Penicillium oxalicum]|uniref:Uncharacterized protein n=1 Tax=Penicillium oxalicum (strain 114-2 / CGMCC 5302) TaxID=933388 RepID=S8B7M5_PENO1|nr:hypothetical protein POX_b02270 [Penicillium oxalicum]EPS30727.1 hypothetical protein PDE_05679 [Penicillium oxalicum 114-2]KAI2792233.1 hypothetical protein POX_b02270 [Penicillium oxalicum]